MASGVKLTKEEIKKELLKCGRDPVYFIKTYVKISHPQRGIIPFKLYPFQEDAIRSFNDYRFNVVLKSRQLGLSTSIAAYCAWLLLFNRSKEIMVVATKFKTASNLTKKVKMMIKRLPSWVRIAEIEVDNKTSFQLSNESQIQASTTSEDAGRSESLSLLIVDEAAFVDKLDDMWKAIYPTLSTGGRCIANSTPNGVGNWFHKTYSEAEQGLNDFNPIKFHWSLHPDRDQEWFEKETRNMPPRDIAQELECNFNMSGETVFGAEDLDRIGQQIREPHHRTGFDRNFWIWQEYDPEANYLLVADTARGDGKDFSTFVIMKLQTLEIVAEYRGQIPTDLFSNIINQAAREYGTCLVVAENNSIGHAVIKDLRDIEYSNLYWSTKGTHKYVDQTEAEGRTDCVPGFTMSMKTRPLIIAKMEEFVRNKMLTTYSKRMIEEMKTFIWNNGRPEAMRTYNDDLIMACAIACWIQDTALQVCKRDLDYKRAFLGAIRKSSTTLNTKIPGQHGALQSEGLEEHKKALQQFPWLFTPKRG